MTASAAAFMRSNARLSFGLANLYLVVSLREHQRCETVETRTSMLAIRQYTSGRAWSARLRAQNDGNRPNGEWTLSQDNSNQMRFEEVEKKEK